MECVPRFYPAAAPAHLPFLKVVPFPVDDVVEDASEDKSCNSADECEALQYDEDGVADATVPLPSYALGAAAGHHHHCCVKPQPSHALTATVSGSPKNRPHLPASWILPMLRSQFFVACERHRHHKKNECTFFCATCGVRPHSICQHCMGSHANHHLVQIRRYVYCDVVRVSDISPYVDVTGVQHYIINQAKVMFLNYRPHSKVGRADAPDVCRTCHRHLREGCTYCSLACKVDALLRGDSSPEAAALAMLSTELESSEPGEEGVYTASPYSSPARADSDDEQPLPKRPRVQATRQMSDQSSQEGFPTVLLRRNSSVTTAARLHTSRRKQHLPQRSPHV